MLITLILKWTVSWTVIKRKVGNVLSDLRLVSATEGARNWEVAGHLISNNNKSYKEHDSIHHKKTKKITSDTGDVARGAGGQCRCSVFLSFTDILYSIAQLV